MRTGFIALIALGALAALPPSVRAEDGWYVSGAGGINFLDKTDNTTAGLSRSTEYDDGGVADLAVGHSFPNGLRLELDYSYRQNDVSSIAGVSAGGSAKVNSILANILYALPVNGWLTPYVGAGAGYGWMNYGDLAPIAGSGVNDTDSGFAYQLIAGVEHRIDDHLSASLSYRYFGMPDTGFTTASGLGVDSDYSSHAIMIGLRWSFGAPEHVMAQAAPAPAPAPMPAPPPKVEAPAPAPAPAQPRRFLIFFDWNKATLTPEARSILASAAAAAKQGQVVRIELTGHADRSGPATYNMRLSQRRADAARAQLVRDGIAAGEIVTYAKGETEPLVPTADGVREPQNRRVEIVFVNR
jgi:OmpA-OmpF porin, OOP family